MKKIVSVCLLCAMLMSLVLAFPIGISAADESVNAISIDNPNERMAMYTSTAPKIDGEIDEVWDNAVAYHFVNNVKEPKGTPTADYVKVLWDEQKLYVLVYSCDQGVKDNRVIGVMLSDTDSTTWGSNSTKQDAFWFSIEELTQPKLVQINSVNNSFHKERYEVKEKVSSLGEGQNEWWTEFSITCPDGLSEGNVRFAVFVTAAANGPDSGVKTSARNDSKTQSWFVANLRVNPQHLYGMRLVKSSSQSGNAHRTGAYAACKPTVDGVEDAIWSTTNANYLGVSQSYVKVLWDEQGLFIFGSERNGKSAMEFAVLADSADDTQSKDSWNNGWVQPNHWNWQDSLQFSVSSDGTMTKQSYSAALPAGAVCKTKKTDDGFDLEIYIPNPAGWNLTENGTVRFAAYHNRSDDLDATGLAYDNVGSTFHNNTKFVKSITFVANPGLPQIKNTSIALHGAQSSAVADGKFDVRFVAEIIGLDAQCAGFEISGSYGSGENMTAIPMQELKTTKAYTSVLAGGKKVTPTKDGNYLVALGVFDIPVSDEIVTVTFTVKPFTVNAEGEKLYGDTAVFTFVSGQ